MHLVPCRWSLTGWKYVKQDPKDQNYFNNPHRINGHGIYGGALSPENRKKMINLLKGDPAALEQRLWMIDNMNVEEIGTTYAKYFSSTK